MIRITSSLFVDPERATHNSRQLSAATAAFRRGETVVLTDLNLAYDLLRTLGVSHVAAKTRIENATGREYAGGQA